MLARLLSVVLCFTMILSLSVCAGNVDDKFYKEDDPTQVIYDAGRKVSLEKLTVRIAKFLGGTVAPCLFALGLCYVDVIYRESCVPCGLDSKGVLQ